MRRCIIVSSLFQTFPSSRRQVLNLNEGIPPSHGICNRFLLRPVIPIDTAILASSLLPVFSKPFERKMNVNVPYSSFPVILMSTLFSFGEETLVPTTYLNSNATSDSTAPSSFENSTLIPASTTGVSSAILSASLVASSLMTNSSIESSSLSQATALQSYTTASRPSTFIPQPSSHVFMPSPLVYTTVPSAAFSPLYTMSSNASLQSFRSTYQNQSSFSLAPLLAAPISGPFPCSLNSSVMPKEGSSQPAILLGFVDQSMAKEMKLKFDIHNNRKGNKPIDAYLQELKSIVDALTAINSLLCPQRI
ncbi:hypothetical protein Tco_1102650 [Tanacetum coccineum]